MEGPERGFERGERAIVHVRSLASNGAGVADLPEGPVAFVPRTAPGDEARVRIARRHPRWADARLEKLLRAAPERVEPPCPLYERCGGCALQHLPYAEQLRWKGRFVSDALDRIGHLEVEPPEVSPSPRPLRYRNRLTFTLRRLRGGRIVAGFHALEEPARVVDVHGECLLGEEPVVRAWEAVRGAWGPGARHLPSGGRLRLTLRATAGGVSLLVEGGAAGWRAEEIGALDALAAVWHRGDGEARPRRVLGIDVEEVWAGEAVPVSGGAFLQVNREAAELLRDHVLAFAGTRPDRAVDAYCGVGVYGRELARLGWRVTGIEVDADASAAARHEAPSGFEVVEGPVEVHLGDALPARLVLLNPPRTGLDPSVPRLLAERPVERIVYVSCDPATLARDAARLAPAYRLSALRAVDLFPQTPHVETVARFEAGGS